MCNCEGIEQALVALRSLLYDYDLECNEIAEDYLAIPYNYCPVCGENLQSGKI